MFLSLTTVHQQITNTDFISVKLPKIWEWFRDQALSGGWKRGSGSEGLHSLNRLLTELWILEH